MENLKYWVWLTQVFGEGNKRIWDALEKFKSAEKAFYAVLDGEFEGLSHAERENSKKISLSNAEDLIESCAKKGMKIISFDSNAYPNRLKGIYNPPAILFCMGDLSFVDNEICLTVVGTRHPSAYSVRLAQKICGELAKVGVVLVSGFALGIDSMAHQAALKNHTRTIAVLGCGLDVDYPKENSAVKKIIAKRGAVISEFLPGTSPNGPNFPQRNRILSGLSLGTLVVEAGERSGALITADLALQQGRDVFCVPPADLFDPRYAGAVKLLRDGAIPVFSHLDIIYEYYENFAHKINPENNEENYSFREDSAVFERESPNPKKQPGFSFKGEEEKIPEINFDTLDERQTRIVKLLQNGAMLADEISALSGMEADEVLSVLTELEIEGIVKSQAGNRYSL